MYGDPVPTGNAKAPCGVYEPYKLRAQMILAGAFLIHLTLGNLHSFGNIAPLIIAYMRHSNGSTDIRYHDGLVIYVSAVVVQGVAGFFGGRLHRLLGPRKAALLGGVIMSIGLVMSALTLHSFLLFGLSFGVITAVGSGLCYPVPLACALEWQPDRKGAVSCVIFLGRSLSVCLLCPMQSFFLFHTSQGSLLNFVSPLGLESTSNELYIADSTVLERLPFLFITMAGSTMVLQVIGAAMLCDPPPIQTDTLERRRKVVEDIRSPSPATAASLLSSFVLTPQDLFSSSSFWLLFSMLFFSWQSLLVAAYIWKTVPFALLNGAPADQNIDLNEGALFHPTLASGLRSWRFITDMHLSCVGAISGCLCILGRLIWGFFGNRAGNKRALIMMNLFAAVLLLTLMGTGTANPHNFCLWLCLLNACHGGLFSVLPSLTSDIFGHKNFGPAFSLLFAARICAAICACVVCKVVIELADGAALCAVLAGCHVCCAMLALFFHPTEALPNPYKLVMT